MASREQDTRLPGTLCRLPTPARVQVAGQGPLSPKEAIGQFWGGALSWPSSWEAASPGHVGLGLGRSVCPLRETKHGFPGRLVLPLLPEARPDRRASRTLQGQDPGASCLRQALPLHGDRRGCRPRPSLSVSFPLPQPQTKRRLWGRSWRSGGRRALSPCRVPATLSLLPGGSPSRWGVFSPGCSHPPRLKWRLQVPCTPGPSDRRPPRPPQEALSQCPPFGVTQPWVLSVEVLTGPCRTEAAVGLPGPRTPQTASPAAPRSATPSSSARLGQGLSEPHSPPHRRITSTFSSAWPSWPSTGMTS